jgi:hypothetical protein
MVANQWIIGVVCWADWELDDRGILRSIPVRGKKLFCFWKCLDRHQNPSNGNKGIFPEDKMAEFCNWPLTPSIVKFKKMWSSTRKIHSSLVNCTVTKHFRFSHFTGLQIWVVFLLAVRIILFLLRDDQLCVQYISRMREEKIETLPYSLNPYA